MEKLSEVYERNKKWLLFSLLVTFIWGMAAHGYCFFDNSISHDSLYEFHASIFGNDWKIQLGRVLVPFYRAILRGDVTVPWLIGVLALLWIGLSVFGLVKIFDLDSKLLIFLIAGVFTTNITVSATSATYINDLDSNMFALLCAVASVYFWNKVHHGAILGAIFIMASLGVYQSYLMVAIVLIILVCILDLFNAESFQYVFIKGLKAVGMLLAGGILYYAVMKAIVVLTGNALSSGGYNSLDKAWNMSLRDLPRLIIGAYQNCYFRLRNVYSTYPSVVVKGITAVLCVVIGIAVITWLCDKKTGILEKMLGMALFALLPLGMNLIYVLTSGETHDLMVFPIWLFYLVALLLADYLVKKWQGREASCKIASLIRAVSVILVFVICYGGVQFANGMYMKKDIEYDAYLSLMTRVVGRMEAQDGYVPGETQVVFAGLPENHNEVIPGFSEYRTVTGMYSTDLIYSADFLSYVEKDRYQAYFDYVLNTPILLAEDAVWYSILEDLEVRQMPSYPANDCIAEKNGIMIVKLGPLP